MGGQPEIPTRFRFEYSVTGAGWAEASIADDLHRRRVTASYLSDALLDLLEAVAAVAEDDSESRCRWAEEPGEYRWIFRREGTLVSVRVLCFTGSGAEDWDGELVFDSVQPVARVARAVCRAAGELLEELGSAVYKDEWGMPFPTDALERLRRSIAA